MARPSHSLEFTGKFSLPKEVRGSPPTRNFRPASEKRKRPLPPPPGRKDPPLPQRNHPLSWRESVFYPSFLYRFDRVGFLFFLLWGFLFRRRWGPPFPSPFSRKEHVFPPPLTTSLFSQDIDAPSLLFSPKLSGSLPPPQVRSSHFNPLLPIA